MTLTPTQLPISLNWAQKVAAYSFEHWDLSQQRLNFRQTNSSLEILAVGPLLGHIQPPIVIPNCQIKYLKECGIHVFVPQKKCAWWNPVWPEGKIKSSPNFSKSCQNSPSGHHVLYLGNLSMRVFEIRPTGHTSGIEKCLFVGWGNSFQCPSNSFRVGWEPWSSG